MMGRKTKQENRVYVKCETCNKIFWKFKSKIKKGYKRHFCSIGCYNKKKKGAGNPNWKSRSVEEICNYCRRTFMKRRGKEKYCSPQCKQKAQIKKITAIEAKEWLNELKKSNLNLIQFAKTKKTTEKQLKKMITEHLPDEYETVQEYRRIKKDKWYSRGRAFERKTRKYLQGYGYIAMPSPRSMGAADLLAVKKGEILLVQCKLYGMLRKNERIALEEMAKQAGGIPILATQKEQKILLIIPQSAQGKRRILYVIK